MFVVNGRTVVDFYKQMPVLIVVCNSNGSRKVKCDDALPIDILKLCGSRSYCERHKSGVLAQHSLNVVEFD